MVVFFVGTYCVQQFMLCDRMLCVLSLRRILPWWPSPTITYLHVLCSPPPARETQL